MCSFRYSMNLLLGQEGMMCFLINLNRKENESHLFELLGWLRAIIHVPCDGSLNK